MRHDEKLAFLRDRLDMAGCGLELGPHVNPMFRKSDGVRVAYLETRPTEALRAAEAEAGRDPGRVEEIDYVLDREKSLAENVGGAVFDWVASSHVLEHIPDFVGHLRDVAEVLRPGGIYGAIVPDRNLCFDCLKPASSLGEVLEAHLERRKRASVAACIDEFRYGALPDGVTIGGWAAARAEGTLRPKYPDWEARVREILGTAGDGSSRRDGWAGHSWRFDPVRFAEILADLCRFGLIGLQLTELVPTYNMDFIAILKKVPKVAPGAVDQIARMVAADYAPPIYRPWRP